MTKNQFKIGVGVVVILATSLVIFLTLRVMKPDVQKTFGMESSEFMKYGSDVIGTHTGTSTVGVYFENNLTATSTYVTKIDRSLETAVYMIKATNASSTAEAQFAVYGSNDDYCDTTTTTATNYPNMSDINWYSAGDHFMNRTHLVQLSTDSSTSFVNWSSPSSTLPGVEIALWNMNYNCLRLDAAASSTELYVGLITK
jgi:hypothetical protein